MDSSNSKKSTILDAEHFSGHNDLMLRTDLLNLHVYICAPEVLLLFSDNFDYQVCYCFGSFLAFIKPNNSLLTLHVPTPFAHTYCQDY